MRTIECEKCGKTQKLTSYTGKDWFVSVKYGDSLTGTEEEEYDLCTNCQLRLKSWFHQ